MTTSSNLNVIPPDGREGRGVNAISPMGSLTAPTIALRGRQPLARAARALAGAFLRLPASVRFFQGFSVRLFQQDAETMHDIYGDVPNVPPSLRSLGSLPLHGSENSYGDDLCFARKTKRSTGVHA